ncbi:Glycoside Hydrolase Family 10 protein [Tuber magnatum]|uniref:Beta-xylanase n=1 Tax=Tuber magnatum TaxID=42249 RepID=A0A317SHD8_9PEZI|nr:Glycoside Hydrolase Family 10 protein [Tuber magnatum]
MKSISPVTLLLLAPSVVMALLDPKIKAKGKMYFGSCADPNTLADENLQTILKTELASRESFNFINADQLVDFATRNGKLVRGHTSICNFQLPSWVSDIADAVTLTTKGKIYAWDVVNEIFNEDGSFRRSVFYNLLGENFVDTAFRDARDADPSAKLYINDYGLDGPDTGLDVAITELDIRIAKPITSALLTSQHNDYSTIIEACLNITKCVGITTWGVSDKDSWVDHTFPGYNSPLLWDDNLAPEAAYTGVDTVLN